MDAILKDVRLWTGVAIVASATAGAAAGYIFAHSQLDAKLEATLNEEIATFKADYARRRDVAQENDRLKAEISVGESVTQAVTEALGYVPSIDEHDTEAEEVASIESNIFDTVGQDLTDWDQDYEESQRTAEPYIISLSEWSDQMYEDRKRLTYFAGDDILADEAEMHIPDVDSIVGEDNLLKFGHGSRDPNVVYVRNDNLEIDFEIILSSGEYAAEVMHLRHSDDRPVLKRFRDRD